MGFINVNRELTTKKIISNTKVKFTDKNKNYFYTDSFNYNLKNNIAKVNSLKLVDSKKMNIF